MYWNSATNSLRVNISADATTLGLTGAGDINDNLNILFVYGSNYDFKLMGDSPAINIGIGAGAPETDILGNPRFGAPDAAACEYQGPNAVEYLENQSQLSIAPNPVQNHATISLSNSWIGPVYISIFDKSGKTISQSFLHKSNSEMFQNFDLNTLAAGQYILTVKSINQKIATSLIKI